MGGKARILHISQDLEVDDEEFDLRTRAGNENHILKQIETHGGFSIFWVTENQRRACAADRLIETGIIERQKDSYPWCSYKINR